MPMTMRETKEAILGMLSAANGLQVQRFWPLSLEIDEYTAPGNYALAESVEREADKDKFNWVAYSSYEEGNYANIQVVKAQVEQLFADNEWCLDAQVNIFHDGDELAHSVRYRFHTFGVELSDSPDGPDFCPSCGWNTAHLKCNAGPDDHPVEDCHYLCPNCSLNTGITSPCLRRITFSMTVRSEVSLTGSQNVISSVSPGVISAVGEILVVYALAENTLRARMVNLPGHNPSSNLSADIERLKKHKKHILASYSAQSANDGQVMEDCIAAIVSAFDKIHAKRTTLAHGQLVHVGLSTSTVTTHGINEDREESSLLQIEHNGVSVELTEDGIQEPLDNIRELQAQVGRLSWILELLAGR